MTRNLRFWARYALESMEAVLGVPVALILVSILLGHGYRSVAALLLELPYLLFMVACGLLFLLNNGTQTLYIPLLMSMGETRRNTFIGFQLCRLAIWAITAALCALLWAVAPEGPGLQGLPFFAVVLLAASALGGIVGTLFVKVKWLGVAIMLVFCGGIGGLAGFLAVDGGLEDIIAGVAEASRSLPWWLVLATAALLAFDLEFHWLVLRKREVKL